MAGCNVQHCFELEGSHEETNRWENRCRDGHGIRQKVQKTQKEVAEEEKKAKQQSARIEELKKKVDEKMKEIKAM